MVVGGGRGSVSRPAVPPQRRTDGAYTGPAGSFLPPQLFARTGNQFAVLGGVSAGTQRGTIMLHRLPQQVFIDPAKDFIGQLQRADFSSLQIQNIYLLHN